MKFLKVIILAALFFLASCSEKFEKLPEKYSNKEALLKKVKPDKNVQYWQLEHIPNHIDESKNALVLFSAGKYEKTKMKIPESKKYDWNGFFSGCKPALCVYRITYLENNMWKMVNSEEDLKKFMGEIDNEQEAFLIGIINDYSIDSNSKNGNGFSKEKSGYKIKMMKYISCPESKESFTFFVDKNGKLSQLKSNGFYLKSSDCIVY